MTLGIPDEELHIFQRDAARDDAADLQRAEWDDRPDYDPGDRIRKADAKRDEMIDEPRKFNDE